MTGRKLGGHPVHPTPNHPFGLTKREWLLGQILEGMVSRDDTCLREEEAQSLVERALDLADLALDAMAGE